jgi:hypothetical protein
VRLLLPLHHIVYENADAHALLLLLSALALGFVAGVAAPVCITDVNVLNGNSVIITHLF